MDDHMNSLSNCSMVLQTKHKTTSVGIGEKPSFRDWWSLKVGMRRHTCANSSDHKHPIASSFHGNECNPTPSCTQMIQKCFGFIFPSFSQFKNNAKVNNVISCISLDLVPNLVGNGSERWTKQTIQNVHLLP